MTAAQSILKNPEISIGVGWLNAVLDKIFRKSPVCSTSEALANCSRQMLGMIYGCKLRKLVLLKLEQRPIG